MFVLEFRLVEVDWCPGCQGVWLDSGELELIGTRAGALEGELLAALDRQRGGSPTGGEKRPCPLCGKQMDEVHTDTTPPIVVDRCPREHGLWFDQGELQSLVRAAGAREENVLARFFAELEGGSGQGEPDRREAEA
jgi:Zn-finger nucleic acid-binding protein